MTAVLGEIQARLERLYDVALPVQVQDYLLDGDAAAALAVSGDSMLVVQEEEGTLDVGVYVEPPSLERLSRRDPFTRLDGGNLADFCAATEEVSHFTYLVFCALHHRPVTRLELELQAEVDKFVTAALCLDAQGESDPEALAVRLFERYRLKTGLDAESRERYETANALGGRYCRSLARRYLGRDRQLGPMVTELRRFYRLPQVGKLESAAAAAV